MIKHLKKGQPTDSKKEQNQSVRGIVENILARVESEGDAAIREYSEKFDKWTPKSFKLSTDEIKACYAQLDDQLINDIKWAQSQVRNFAKIQRDSMKDVEVETLPGVTLGHKHLAMDSVGCYVPGGKYPLLASAHMSVLTAKVAGVKRVIAMAPPFNGKPSPEIVVARDMAHAKLLERLQAGDGLPTYLKDRIVYYAGPAKTPEGYASGSFGPTTAGRMDSYLDPFMEAGGSFITLAKGNRGKVVTEACKKFGGFYLGSIGGPAALLATDSIKKVAVLEYPELGMEAIWQIDVVDFPAFIVVDDKGNDFYASLV